MKEVWYILDGALLGRRRDEILPFATRKDLEEIVLREVSQDIKG